MEKKINLHANHRQRLKNRALNETLENFEPHNVLELMLFYVLPHVDTNDIAHELINHFGSFDGVFAAPIDELMRIKGIKSQAATFIKLLPEFARYYLKGHPASDDRRFTIDKMKEFFVSAFVGMTDESVCILYFDPKFGLIDSKMYKGDISKVDFPIKRMINDALRLNAHSVSIAHNHPKGLAIPSDNDLSMYKMLKSMFAQVDMSLVDSYIVGGNTCVGTREFINRSNEDAVKRFMPN